MFNDCFPGGFKAFSRMEGTSYSSMHSSSMQHLAAGSPEGHCIRKCRGNLKLSEYSYPSWNLAKVSKFNIATHPRSLKDPL